MSAAYIFDVEGTLIDCVPAIIRCWNETFAEFGISVPWAHLQRLSGMDGDDMLVTLVPDLDKEKRKKILAARSARYRDVYLATVKAFPDVRTVLAAIRSRDGRIALATGCHNAELKQYRALMDVDDLIDAIACGEDVSKGKPDSGLVEMALDHLGGTPPVFATVIGDTPFDAQAARRAGAAAWGVLAGGHPKSSLIDAGCSLIVPSVGDLVKYFRHDTPQALHTPRKPVRHQFE
jgi:phosphoglycolate phosphatase-like HAD superfamily hydrolase